MVAEVGERGLDRLGQGGEGGVVAVVGALSSKVRLGGLRVLGGVERSGRSMAQAIADVPVMVRQVAKRWALISR